MFLSDTIEKPIEVPEDELKKKKAKTHHQSLKKNTSKLASASEISKIPEVQDITVPLMKVPI